MFLIMFISFSSGYRPVTGASVNPKIEQTKLTPDSIFEKTNNFFKDKTYTGFVDEKNDSGIVTNNVKLLTDEISAVRTIVEMVKYTQNSTYLNLVPGFLATIEQFNNSNNGYYSSKNKDWSNVYQPYLSPIDTSYLISMYSQLYNVTGNKDYLTKALANYNFLENYFNDTVNGGFKSKLDPNSLSVISGYDRVTGYYGIIAQAFLDLYSNTNNMTILANGFELLNNTIQVAFDYNNVYFKPALYESSNTPDPSFTMFKGYEQLDIASSLLRYSFIQALPQYDQEKVQFLNLSLAIGNKLESKLINNEYMMMEGFDTATNIVDTNTYASRQAQLYNYILDLKDHNMQLNTKEQTILDQSSAVLSKFVGQQSGLFVRRPDLQVTSPWINYAIINTMLNLENHSIPMNIQIQSTTTKMITTTSTSTLTTTTSVNGIFVMIGFIGLYLVKKYSRNKK